MDDIDLSAVDRLRRQDNYPGAIAAAMILPSSTDGQRGDPGWDDEY